MLESLIHSPRFATFLLASLILVITPGPGVIYLLTRTLSRGRRAGLTSVGGVAVGNLGNAGIASLGLAVVVAQSVTAFAIVKYAGAAYLLFLGLQTLRSKPATRQPAAATHPGSQPRFFRDGFLVALLNPKTALFFAALLPQFIQPEAPPLPQTLCLGGIFVLVALCTDTVYVLAAAALAPVIRSRSGMGSYGRYFSAATLFGLGLYAALASPRQIR